MTQGIWAGIGLSCRGRLSIQRKASCGNVASTSERTIVTKQFYDLLTFHDAPPCWLAGERTQGK